MKHDSRAARQTRRAFLKAVGLGATALPFYGMLENSVVQAQTGIAPLRFVGFGFFHGTVPAFYARSAGESDVSFSLTHADSPFRPFDDAATYGQSFKDRLTIFEGFDFGVGELAPDGSSMHVPMHGAMGLLLTGSSQLPSGSLQNASLDQVLAAKYGGTTRFRSVQIRGYDQLGFPLSPEWLLSFGQGGAPLAPLESPVELWDKFFAGTVVGSDSGAAAAAARKRAIGASILDFVVGDIGRLSSRLAGPERQKLDQHLTVVRGLERRLASFETPSGCTTPPRRDPATSGYRLDKFEAGNVLKICDFNLELLAAILTCDLTRFATFLLPNEPGPDPSGAQLTYFYDGSQVPVTDGTAGFDVPIYNSMHDQCAHMLGDGADPASRHSQRVMASINRFYFSRIARFMQRMAAADLLDSTVILAGSDGGHGSAHSTQHVPILLAGGTGGQVPLGRRVVAPGRSARVGSTPSGAALTSHNAILAAVGSLFGEPLSSFGTCARADFTAAVPALLG